MAVIGSRSRKDGIGQLVRYIFSDKGKLDHDERCPPIYWNMHAHSPEEAIACFQDNESRRRVKRKDSVHMYHDHFSIHPKDREKVTVPMLEDLAFKYIELRSGKQSIPIFARAHLDHENPHVHFAIAGVDLGGRSSRLSNARFTSIRRQFENYQKDRYPQLEHSIVYDKEKFQMLDKQKSDQARRAQNAFRNAKAGRKPNKKIISAMIIEKARNQAQNFTEFQQQLESAGIQFYRRSGRLEGIVYRKQKFRFTTLKLTTETIRDLETFKNIDDRMQRLQTKTPTSPQIERQ